MNEQEKIDDSTKAGQQSCFPNQNNNIDVDRKKDENPESDDTDKDNDEGQQEFSH